jgi:hypothetical protein
MKLPIPDGLIFIGLALFVYSCWTIHPLAGMFTLSATLIAVGIVGLRREVK